MSLAVVYSRAQLGINAPLVTVEVHLSMGLPGFSIVGLPEAAVRESKDRVRSAIINSHFEFPAQKITVNLAPADLPKEGGRYDLAIAIGILAASEQINHQQTDRYEFLGELALSGEVRSIPGVLPGIVAANRQRRPVFIPAQNKLEASIAPDAMAYAVTHLQEVCTGLQQPELLQPLPLNTKNPVANFSLQLSEVQGQLAAKRALIVAASGKHNLLFFGPPGTGKTMLAKRLPVLMPPLEPEQSLELAMIYSISKQQQNWDFFQQAPFRSPHHTSSGVALVGGGSNPKPGEISLAHHGILFLDEVPEFERKVLEVLREPMESGQIHISRAAQQITYPAQFQLIAAMNPCPCGYYGDNTRLCRCNPDQIRRYRQKISGPLLDRIDMHVAVLNQNLSFNKTLKPVVDDSVYKTQVLKARQKQMQRQGKLNFDLNHQQLEKHCPLDKKAAQLLDQALNQNHFSGRALHRILRLSRTIADLENSDDISSQHLAESLSYRTLDRPIG